MSASSTFPHRYQVTANAEPDGEVVLATEGPRPIKSLAPVSLGGPGGRWSPETLLVGAVADCFALTFRAVARAAHLSWEALECEADGTLDRVERVPRFTEFRIRAFLRLPHGAKEDEGRRVLARAQELCLITHSLSAPCRFEGHIDVAESTEAA